MTGNVLIHIYRLIISLHTNSVVFMLVFVLVIPYTLCYVLLQELPAVKLWEFIISSLLDMVELTLAHPMISCNGIHISSKSMYILPGKNPCVNSFEKVLFCCIIET